MPDTAAPSSTAPAQAGAPPKRSPLSRSGEEVFGAVVDPRVLRRFLAFLAPYRWIILASIGAVLAFTLTQLAVPLVIRYVIDTALPAAATAGSGEAERLLGIALVGFFAVVAVNFVSNYCQQVWVATNAERVLQDLRRAMYAHLQRVSLSFMDRIQVGQLMARLQGDVGALQEFFESSIFAIGDLALLAGIVVVLLALDLELGLLTLSVVPILIFVRAVWLPAAKRAFLRARETSSIVNAALAENINGVRTVQEMTREDFNFAAFREKAAENYRTHVRATRLAQVMVPTVDTLTGAAMAIVIVVGGNRVLEGSLEIGVVVAFLFYVQRFFDPIRSLTMQYSVMQQAMASGQRIFEVLDVPIEVKDKPGAVDLTPPAPPRPASGAPLLIGGEEDHPVTFGAIPPATPSPAVPPLLRQEGKVSAPRGLESPRLVEEGCSLRERGGGAENSVEFRNVTFGYVPGLPILRNVSFRVEPGETVALVGPTGSGKTSTMALLHRFYDVWEGEVLIGGVDVRDATQESLGRRIAMVLQEPFLFTGTVFENIRYCTQSATRDDVERAARLVGAHDFIVRLPHGYDTLLGQRGVNLSIGQRQLLSFARAIVADAGILVLDEATASVDSFTEAAIQSALEKTLAGRTGLIIAHRLATVRNADRIIVLQDGRIVEHGTHEQLLARGGLYHRLHAMNVASFDDVSSEFGPAVEAGGT